MAIFAQTFDANSVEPSNFDVFPAGKYLAQIVSSEMRPTKDGRGQYLFLELDILEGQFVGRKLFDRLNLVSTTPTPWTSPPARCRPSAAPPARCRSRTLSSCT